MVRRPNFFLIGAAKSGSTTLWGALRQHPEIYLPEVKEPHLIAYLTGAPSTELIYGSEEEARREYDALYLDARDEVAVGDASASTLHVAGCADVLAREAPAAQLVVILRHPADRAFSQWMEFRRADAEDVDDFDEVVRIELAGGRPELPFTYEYVAWGRYHEQLGPFFERFGADRLLVHLYDDLVDDARGVVQRTAAFLGVDPTFRPEVGHLNRAAGSPDSPGRRAASRLLRGRRRAPEPVLSTETRALLIEHYRDDLERLQDLIGRDLGRWLAPRTLGRDV